MKKWLAAMTALICLLASAQAEEFHLIFHGDWDRIQTLSYQSSMADLFETTYPRLYARWGTEQSPATVLFKADAEDHTSVAYAYSNCVVVSVDYVNRKPRDRGYFSHELTHMVQSYGDKIEYNENSWWVENMADYGRFRYYQWISLDQMEPSSRYAEDWMDWGYQSYGNSQWFFAYMDYRYPTIPGESGAREYGLIDSIHLLIHANFKVSMGPLPHLTANSIIHAHIK